MHYNDFIPYVQPILESNTNQLIGCEVLVRWIDCDFNIRLPESFIPYIERKELIVNLTRDLMCKVKTEFLPVETSFPEGFKISFNINEEHCHDENFACDCHNFMSFFVKNPVLLVLEVTEKESFDNDEYYNDTFKIFKSMGVLLAMDDFGVGYANFEKIKRFDFDFIKIDKSFIKGIGINHKTTKIIESMVNLSSALGLQTVAEGVETQTQVDELRRLNVDYLQGFFYGVPTPIPEFIEKWLKN